MVREVRGLLTKTTFRTECIYWTKKFGQHAFVHFFQSTHRILNNILYKKATLFSKVLPKMINQAALG
jgi:hypothetical protein